MNADLLSAAPLLRTFGLALVAVSLGMPRPVAAQGQACTLKGPLVITSKPKGQGRKIHLTAGTSVEILGRQQTWLQLRVNGQEGYGQFAQVRHICAPHNKGGTDALAELPLEALPLPALASLPDANAGGDAAKPSVTPAKPAEQPPKVAATKPSPEPANASPSLPAPQVPEPAAAPPPPMAATLPPAPQNSPPMAFYPPPESRGTLHLDPTVTATEEATPPRRLGALRASLWTAAGVTLVGGGAWYIYNNTAAYEKQLNQILAFKKRVDAEDPTATAAEAKALNTDRTNWYIARNISLGVACLGAALAITAGVFTIIGDTPGSTDSDVSSPPADPLHRLSITPFGLAGTF